MKKKTGFTNLPVSLDIFSCAMFVYVSGCKHHMAVWHFSVLTGFPSESTVWLKCLTSEFLIHVQNLDWCFQESIRIQCWYSWNLIQSRNLQQWSSVQFNSMQSPFFSDLESTKKWGLSFFHSISPPCLGQCFFSELNFMDSSLSLPLICWRQGFRYGFLESYGIIICTRPNFWRTMLRKRAT